MYIKKALLVILSAGLLIASCKDAWLDDTEISPDNKLTVLDKIAAEPTLSKFYGYLKQTKLDAELASSRVYTVWAPNDAAIDAFLSSQAPGYFSDTVKLNQFVKYYIANIDYTVAETSDTLRVKTLGGLKVNFKTSAFEEAPIVKADQLARNGVLHILSMAIPVKSSVFTYANSLSANSVQLAAMASLDTVIPNGVKRGRKWGPIAQAMLSPDSLLTYFVLSNTAYNTELNKIKPYYFSTKTHPDSTVNYITTTTMLENLVVRGLYLPNKLPDTLVSIAGTKIPLKGSAVVSSYKANNGIVYVLNDAPYRLKDRIREFKIEGEQTVSTQYRNGTAPNGPVNGNTKAGNTFIRYKIDNLGVPYRDIEVYNHGQAEFYIQYRKDNVHTVKYDVYVRATSATAADAQITAFTQRFAIPLSTNYNLHDVKLTHVVNPLVYTEVYLGQFTPAQYGTMLWRLLSASSTAAGVNTLMLDYARFVPVIP